jgi:hypothetical protein
MNNNYLVIFSAHVDNEIKKNETIQTLKHLRDSKIDVCLSTHSTLYLDELSEYVKYVIYDNNNEFLSLQDYLDNCNHINSFKYGMSQNKTFHSFGVVTTNNPCSPHSKSALLLIRNGIILSEFNKYDWTFYLEYDIKIPTLGFKHFFDYHIDILVKRNKKCFYYENRLDDESFISLWGGPFVFNTTSVFNHNKFIKNDWFSTKEGWIEEWHLGFFESILEHIINDVFDDNEIIVENIHQNYKKFWNVDNFYQIGKFNYKDNSQTKNQYLKESLNIHIFPNMENDGDKKLYLYYYNSGEKTIKLKKILVYSNTLLHINKSDIIVNPYNWSIIPIDIDKLTDDDKITLTWEGSLGNENYSGTESIIIGNLDSVHNNIMNINFNKKNEQN